MFTPGDFLFVDGLFLALTVGLLIALFRVRLHFAILTALIVISLITWVWLRVFPSAAHDYSQGAATLLAGIIAAVVTGAVALSEYQRAQRARRETTIAIAAKLLSEMMGVIEEIDDIMYGYKAHHFPKITDSWKSVTREDIARIREIHETLRRRLKRFISRGASQNTATFGLSPAPKKQLNSPADPPDPPRHYPEQVGELYALDLKLAPTAHDEFLTGLRSLSDDRYWKEAVIAIGIFYGHRAYVRSILTRAIDLAPLHGRRANQPQESDKLCLEYRRLIRHYFISLCELNLIKGPIAISAVLLALSKNTDKHLRQALGPIAERALHLYDINSIVNIYDLFGVSREEDTDDA